MHKQSALATARKLACFAWHILTSGEPYRYVPPLHTYEKIRQAQILAGFPKHKPGSKLGKPSNGGRQTYLARRKADHNLAKSKIRRVV
jgi:hypothetical protein